MIESIELKNWKTHLDSRLEFGKGTNVLVGAMGSGKSSVMDAICFALFGTFPGLQGRRVAIEEVIMNKPLEAEEAEVKLEFGYGNKSYAVERKIKRKGSTEAKLYCGGKAVAGPKPRDVNKAIEKAIEMNYNLFSRAVYSEQNGIDYFLRITPRERKAKFDELLDLDRYEKVRGNAVTALNRLKAIAKDKGQWLEEQKKALEKEDEKSIRERIEKKEKNLERLEEGIESRKKAMGEMEKKVRELEGKEKEFRSLKEKVGQKRAVIEQLEKELEATKKESGGKSLKKAEEEKEILEKEGKEIEKQLSENKAEEERETGKKEKKGKEAVACQGKAEEFGKRVKELEKLGGECPTCRQKLEEKTREKLVQETKLEMKKAVAEMEKAVKEEALTAEKVKGLKEEAEELKKKSEALKEKHNTISQLVQSLKKLDGNEKRVESLRRENMQAEKSLLGLGFDEKELLAKRKKAVEEKAGIESVKKEIESGKQVVDELKNSLERIEKAKQQAKGIEEKVKAVEKNSGKMSYFVNSLLAVQQDLRQNLIATINQAMHDIWPRVYPYRDFVSAKMDVEEGSYELKAREKSGKWVRVEGILSGGERSAAAVCIRIAFSLVLARNLSWLILDEPTHNLDREAVETLGKMMKESLPEMVEQIFVITHDQEMKKAASSKLYVLEREKNEDSSTKPVLVPIEN